MVHEMTDCERAIQAEIKAFKYKMLYEISEAERLGMTEKDILEQLKTVFKTSE